MSYLDLFKVYHFQNKFRLGTHRDGGYVVCELEGNYDCYISAGVGNEESFTGEFIRKFNLNSDNSYAFDGTISSYPIQFTKNISFTSKNIGICDNDSSTNLVPLLQKYKNIFLKMDIEGSEFNWLQCIPSYLLNNIKQLVIEFHGVNDDTWHMKHATKIECWKKLLTTHLLVHAHGNNEGPRTGAIPDTLELTYINRSILPILPPLNTTKLPIENLDFPNNQSRPDYDLNFYPFTSPS